MNFCIPSGNTLDLNLLFPFSAHTATIFLWFFCSSFLLKANRLRPLCRFRIFDMMASTQQGIFVYYLNLMPDFRVLRPSNHQTLYFYAKFIASGAFSLPYRSGLWRNVVCALRWRFWCAWSHRFARVKKSSSKCLELIITLVFHAVTHSQQLVPTTFFHQTELSQMDKILVRWQCGIHCWYCVRWLLYGTRVSDYIHTMVFITLYICVIQPIEIKFENIVLFNTIAINFIVITNCHLGCNHLYYRNSLIHWTVGFIRNFINKSESPNWFHIGRWACSACARYIIHCTKIV